MVCQVAHGLIGGPARLELSVTGLLMRRPLRSRWFGAVNEKASDGADLTSSERL